MSPINNFDFLKHIQKGNLEPDIKPGETALEAIQRLNKEKVDQITTRQQPPPSAETAAPPAQEVVFYEGYKFSRDFFTCLSLCIIKMNDPEINKILETFGFTMKDLTGKPVVLKPTKKKRK